MNCITHLIILFVGLSASLLMAQKEIKPSDKSTHGGQTIEVEVKLNGEAFEGKRVLRKETLEFVSYNKDKTLFVGYYQDGWSEMVSLHDAKTKKQIASIYCDGGVAKEYRFSKDNKFLGAKASVGWYVWKIPSFEEVLILGDLDFNKLTIPAQPDAAQPDTASVPKPEKKETNGKVRTVYLSVNGMC